LTSER